MTHLLNLRNAIKACAALVFASSVATASTVFTSDAGGNIYKYSGSGSDSLFYSYQPGAAATSQLSFGPDGALYAILSDSSIVSFDQSGISSTVLSSFPSPVTGFAIDGNSNIFTSDSGGNIYKYSESGSGSLFYGYQPGAAATSQLSFGPNGALYAILSDSSIVSFDQSGISSTVLSTFPSPVTGFAIDGNSNIFTSDSGGNIYKYSGAGSGSLFYGYQSGAAATSQLSFGPDGALYAILSDSSIVSFDQSGVPSIVLDSFPSPVSGFAMVPEPSTFLVGLLSAGFFLYRRTRCRN